MEALTTSLTFDIIGKVAMDMEINAQDSTVSADIVDHYSDSSISLDKGHNPLWLNSPPSHPVVRQ
jgi:hypothetical protein